MNALSNVLDDVKYNNGLQDAEAPDPQRAASVRGPGVRQPRATPVFTLSDYALVCRLPTPLYTLCTESILKLMYF